ncbi:hypothetical protein BD324DRAFT_677980 [Kockovaella imperatae]|uniref:LysM domain-containing protein n=1 Tax=Kockovaella imperatae TaxID=4999 RepID=A0A1Y1URF8_9TREE|nr:hypothetical protein BD324DRAFT_677980 [Kockovaella imperatae]ORX40522.1 hypothetical protein BD324DRAFT_677980 [Kockovaella imperatae]
MTFPRSRAVESPASSFVNEFDPWGGEEDQTSRHARTISTLSAISHLSQSPSKLTSPLRRRRLNGAFFNDSENGEDGSDHPLSLASSPGDSRPTLSRLLSETERQVAESSTSGASSTRGSLDLLRMSKAEEVEVFVHQVKQSESLAGIALLYGIELPTLRKVNKLWPSDPVHLRTHLYVPLDACRWNKAKETFSRGPGEGQATLTPKNASHGKGKGRAQEPLIDHFDGSRSSMDTVRPSDPQSPRVLDIVRVPSSQLSFFPKSKGSSARPSLDMQRKSLDNSKLRRSVSLSSKAFGPDIHHDLSTLPSAFKPPDPPSLPPLPTRSKTVRLRPPVAQLPPRSESLADKLSSLFTVPPPPITYTLPVAPKPPRKSTESASSSRQLSIQPEVSLEMFSRVTNNNHSKKHD